MIAKLLKVSAASALQRLGITVAPNWAVPNLMQARYLQRLFAAMRVDCVFDVGANKGQYGLFLREQVGYKGLIISFEPIPENAEAIRLLAKRFENWEVDEIALGASEGVMSFNVMADSVFSSFLNPVGSGEGRQFAANRIERKIQVNVKTLDSVFGSWQKRFGFITPYLKLDTQGFDLEVLRGARDTLPQIVSLQTEASVQPIYREMPNYRTVIDFLGDKGFEVGEIFSVSDAGFPFAVEFDCHMVSRRLYEEKKRS